MLSLNAGREIKHFKAKTSRQFITNKPTLQKILECLLYTKERLICKNKGNNGF